MRLAATGKELKGRVAELLWENGGRAATGKELKVQLDPPVPARVPLRQQLGKNWKNLDFIFPRTRVSNAGSWGRAVLAR